MKDLFRWCSVTLVALWFGLLVALIVFYFMYGGSPGHNGVIPVLVVTYWWVGAFGLLPTAALFHIAAEVSEIREALVNRGS